MDEFGNDEAYEEGSDTIQAGNYTIEILQQGLLINDQFVPAEFLEGHNEMLNNGVYEVFWDADSMYLVWGVDVIRAKDNDIYVNGYYLPSLMDGSEVVDIYMAISFLMRH